MKSGYSGKRISIDIALIGLCAATIECGKLVLAFIPNIEVVTLLTALFGYVFGFVGVMAAIVFVSIEPLIYGFGTWVISYYLYWPFVAVVFWWLGAVGAKRKTVTTMAAVLLTVWFGILTSIVDVGLFLGYSDNFFYRFGIYYMRGMVFYTLQIICNAVLFPLLFTYLADKLKKIKTALE